ncbi:SMP-30/gluconolactonase/LRE family protein [Deinococcus radiophilus]|uniref:SMP-30/gluconolactonase/LRE family protein n=1 Tax=Deinococcus radiophilus TaxID=32062 RepID=A0A3S0KGG1_9DEIO|nr:SMP-30/gluconolactonase/LRE family protein [Deinococcus radiophilus]RTR30340.1 SMP-30/gluconolactonase/LRE family protein [Deinococcus radiophilus]UFA49862.1 SMP-30/gluconolactonase/LRE family protein [Deinococcus radiophilus]
MSEVLQAAQGNFRELFPEDAELTRLADGFTWTEGPVWIPARGCVVFSDVRQNRTWRWSAGEGLQEEMNPSHHQNGHCLDAEGRLVACSHGERAVLRQEVDGSWTTLADHWEGNRLNSPNDVALHPDGSLWFTDPTYGIDKPEEGYGGEMEQPGRYVYRIAPDGALSCSIQDRHKPNGLAFLSDTELLLADTGDNAATHLYRVVGQQAEYVREAFQIDQGKTDGLRVDAEGRIWSSAGDGVHVLNREGEELGRILVPETVANLCFGGAEGNELFITATTGLYHIQTRVLGW